MKFVPGFCETEHLFSPITRAVQEKLNELLDSGGGISSGKRRVHDLTFKF